MRSVRLWPVKHPYVPVLVSLGALCVPLGSEPASAACAPLVSDATGDATVSNPSDGSTLVAAGSDPALDIVSADVAADARSFTVVVRLAGDVRTSTWPAGHSVEAVFRAGGETQWNLNTTFPTVGAAHTDLGQTADGTPTSPGSTQISADGRVLRMSVPSGAFATLGGPPMRVGRTVYDISLYTNRAAAADGSGVYLPTPADVASTKRSYRAGSSACVRP